MAGGGSKLAVYAAITANSVVMTAKFTGFLMTGSGAMLSEAVHSLADVGNQALLAFGMKQATKEADAEHPLGYGQEAFVWALVSAVGMFFLGCGVSIAHGLESMFGEHHGIEGGNLAIGILVFSLVIEGISFAIAMKGVLGDARKHGKGFFEYMRTTEDPFGVAIILEDGAAVFGVLVALVAVVLAEVTHDPRWDAAGTLVIGVLLGAVALFLVQKNRSMLLGKAVGPEDQRRLQEIFDAHPAIESVAMSAAVVRGTDAYRISAELDFDGAYLARQYLEEHDVNELHAKLDSPDALARFLEEYGEQVMELVGDEVDRIEAEIQEKIPKATGIALEPD